MNSNPRGFGGLYAVIGHSPPDWGRASQSDRRESLLSCQLQRGRDGAQFGNRSERPRVGACKQACGLRTAEDRAPVKEPGEPHRCSMDPPATAQTPVTATPTIVEDQLVKSRHRVKAYGEVLTPRHMVDRMLDLVRDGARDRRRLRRQDVPRAGSRGRQLPGRDPASQAPRHREAVPARGVAAGVPARTGLDLRH